MSQQTILLVEDNPDDVLLTQRALKKSNIFNPVVVAADGQEALDYLYLQGRFAGRSPDENPIVVLLDLKLPKITGLEVLQRVRQDDRTKLLPIVVLTSSKEEDDIASSYHFGANSYIRKPVDFAEFSNVIRQMGLYWLLLNVNPNPSQRK